MAQIPLTIGLDWRVSLVDATGAAIGTTGNPINVLFPSGGGSVVTGSKSNNSAFAGSTNLGVFPAIAMGVNPTYTEGFLVALSTDLSGNLRVTSSGGSSTVTGTKSNNAVVPGTTNLGVLGAVANAAAPTLTETFQTALSTDLSGNLRTINTPSGTQAISGSVSVSNFPVTQPVSGTVTANAGSGTFTVGGTVAVSNFPATVAVTQSTSPWVVSGTVTSTPSGVQVVTGNKTSNAAIPNATNIGTLGAVANAAAPTFTETFQTALSVDLSGNLRTINTPSGTQPISGTVTANQGTTPWTTQGALALGVSAGGAQPFVMAGQFSGNVKLLALDTLGQLTANQGTSGPGGTSGWSVQGQSAIGAALAGLPLTIGILDSSNHVQVPINVTGAQATTGTNLLGVGPLNKSFVYGANPTEVTAGQYAFPPAGRNGIPFMLGGNPNTITVRANYTTAQTNTVVVANSAGTKIIVTGFLIDVDNAATVNVQARIGLAQTVTPTTTGVFGSHPGIAPGSGIARGSGSGILGVGADGDQILFTGGVPTSGSVDCIVTYFTTAS